MNGAPRPDAPLLRPVADRALLVEFGEAIGDAAHGAVLRLDRALAAAPFAGLVETVPAFVNLLVVFDPLLTDHAAAAAAVRAALATAPSAAPPGRLHDLPICYDNAPDLAEVAARTGMDVAGVIAAHLAGDYQIRLYGFAPGYAYMSGVPQALRLDRKPSPRRGVPAGSVIIAGGQCLITTLTMPTGWWIIGHCPVPILTGDPARPFLFDVGDRLRFHRIQKGAAHVGG